jgi:hypothetical protein
LFLKAGNHKEIARSCPYENKAMAMAVFGFYPERSFLGWQLKVATNT